MKKPGQLLFILFILLISNNIHAQLKETITALIQSAADSAKQPIRSDSVYKPDLEKELQQARLSESNLRMELEQLRLASMANDSLKLQKQKLRIDSLRVLTKGIPVIVEEDTLFYIFAKRGGLSPADRAENFSKNISELGKKYSLHPDSVYIEPTEYVTDIMYKSKVLLSLTDQDAIWQNSTREKLANEYRAIVVKQLHKLKVTHSLLQLGKRIFWFVLVIVVQFLLYRLTTYLYKKLKRWIIQLRGTRLKPISIHDYELFDTGKQVKILIFFSNIIRYLVILVQLLLTVPILFSIFPQTEKLAMKLFSYLWNPVRSITLDIVNYIPNLFTIFVIYFVIRYLIKGIKYLANEIELGKLKITGFYPDWAQPSYQIVRFLMYAFMIAMIYPYLPGSKSAVFQGISVFVGLIVSIGSSTAIGNIIAGLVITYMRPFKIGDRIKLNDTTGNVIEKTPFVTRLKTPKNELVTIPNSFIMSSHTTNYSSSARNYGLIIHSEITIGYDAPWRKVHELLIAAAQTTPGVIQEPEPFVLETALNDWYPVYQVNAYIRDADSLAQIYSDLHQNIQDKFNEAGIEIMSPQYIATRSGNESTIPKKKK